jgi:putative ABC transport system permease protein
MQDVRYAFRALRRTPVFTLAAVLTLALGIGANTAVFSVVQAVLLRALPYPDPEQVVFGWGRRGAERIMLVNYPDIVEWQRRSTSFSAIGVERSQSVNLTGADAPDRLEGNFITASTLTLLGAHAALGRLFTDAETAPGTGAAVCVLSYGTWKERFGSDPNIIGRQITLNGMPHVVIGVLTDGFHDPQGRTAVFLPVTSAPDPRWKERGGYGFWTIMRMKPGVTVAQAQADLSNIMAQLAKEYPKSNEGRDANVIPVRTFVAGDIRPMLLTVFGFVAVVLLIACANVANLQMARATARRRELSLRAALGAGRARLARQLLTENVLLAVAGGAIGLLIAVWATRVLVAAMPSRLPNMMQVTLDSRVLMFSLLATLGAGLLFGAAPALYGGRVALREALDSRVAAGGAGRRFGTRDVVVAAQLALCVMLLVGAGLLTRTLIELRKVDMGFEPTNVLTAEFRLPRAKYSTDQQVLQFDAAALDALRQVPGFQSVAFVMATPLSGNYGNTTYELEGQPAPASRPEALQNSASPGFFKTLGIRLAAGRDFDEHDRLDAPLVAIVSESFARSAWPGQDPLGRRVHVYGPPEQVITVVGVVEDVKQRALDDKASGMIWQPVAQTPDIFHSVVARTTGDPDAQSNALRAAIWSVDKDQPVWRVRSLRSFVDLDLAPHTFALTITGLFAVLAVILAIVGVYGVMSYLLALRTREIGIRVALGARRSQVERLVLGRSVRVVGVAMVVGIAGAAIVARLMSSQLYGVSAGDALTFTAAPLLLIIVAMFASWIPARRAARVDPVTALRTE